MDANEHKYYYFYLCLSVVSLILFPISSFRLKGFGHFDIFSAISTNARATWESAYFS
jgi:hypothetical protein